MATSRIHRSDEPRTADKNASVSHPHPLKVAIIGAGIGGLAAAIGLRRQGHHISLYERSSFATEVGAGVHIAPNANGILRRWGVFAEQFGGTLMNYRYEFYPNGELIRYADLNEPNSRWQHPWHLVHRVALHDELRAAATGKDGPGRPAVLHTASKITHVDPIKGYVTLEDGSIFEADVILGADGVHSKTREFISEDMPQVISTGKGAFRFLMSREVAEKDPETRALVNAKDTGYMWFGDDRRVILYPCNWNSTLNFVCIHPESESHAMAGDEWNKSGSLEQLFKVFRGFDPTLLRLFEKMDPDELKVWQLLDMEKPPTWVNERLALLGDAAHPYTPYQGQGACQAIEDAAAIAVVLPLGTSPAAVSEHLKLYEKIRYERAHAIQDHSRKVGADWKNGKPQVDPTVWNYIFAHDAYDHAQDILKRYLWKKMGNPHWAMPVSFGPSPDFRNGGLRQAPNNNSHQEFTTATIRFRTSRTYLESLLPTKAYTYEGEATVCEASFSVTTQKNVSLLGGSAYSQFGLYMHGVQYRKEDGSAVQGSFVPVLLANSTDMVISMREDMGMPALFCDLEVCSSTKYYRIKASWRGVAFAELVFEDLEDDPQPLGDVYSETSDCDTLAHRYMPSIGGLGNAEASYAIFATKTAVTKESCEVGKRLRSKRANIKVESHDRASLPTLHHVAAGLASIPVYSVVAAEVIDRAAVVVEYSYLEARQAMAANQLPIPKRFTTTHNTDGKAIFDTSLNDEIPETNTGGHRFFLGYATDEYPVDLECSKDIETYQYYAANQPGLVIPGGTVLRFVDFPPGNSAMHRTVSMDYGIVLEGEVNLALDSGESRQLKRGDVAIQRGTMHQWVNPSGHEWARMVFILQESKPVKVNGTTLKEDYGDLTGVIRPSGKHLSLT
ncbi:hypothetical protein FZEAL_654 [Fusarium zealandicum]|uniref:FAD-binding domain-containing protein n=1 Tax=Fusarium zealandicum TaxID=1053134 RepID=A0A8H4UUB0_9HYPO|nr:hypothetical protein FZEAL_654 [Fusarium zealandicum]